MSIPAKEHADQARQVHSYVTQARAALGNVRTGGMAPDELRAFAQAVAAVGEADENASVHVEVLDGAAEKAITAQHEQDLAAQEKAKADAEAAEKAAKADKAGKR